MLLGMNKKFLGVSDKGRFIVAKLSDEGYVKGVEEYEETTNAFGDKVLVYVRSGFSHEYIIEKEGKLREFTEAKHIFRQENLL